MLKVDDYEKIKKAILHDGMSQREAAKTFKHGRDTIRKILAHATPPGYQRSREPVQPVIEPFKAILDAWVQDEIDRKVHRKQRSNAKVLCKRLQDEYSFKGSVYPVRRYLKKKKRSLQQEAYFPLVFGPAEEAQVDWGEAWVTICGERVQVHLFCMRLCYSRAPFVRAYVNEKLECFLDGHVKAFRFFGGVPRGCAYDNLRTAVLRVGVGQERDLHPRFVEMRCHYVFNSRFCNIESGNEKGRVENLVKLAQSDFLAGVPAFSSLDDLNAYLERCCKDDLQRLAPQSEESRQQLFIEEQPLLQPLRYGDFDACIKASTIAAKNALVRYQNNFYSLPVRWAHHQVSLKAFADRMELWCKQELVAVHPRCWEEHKFLLNYLHYIPLLERKPGGLNHARPFKGEPWGEDFKRYRIELEYRKDAEGTREFIEVLLLFTKYPEDRVKEAVKQCLRRRLFSAASVKGLLDYLPPAKKGVVDVSEHPALQVQTSGMRPIAIYDQERLQQGGQAS